MATTAIEVKLDTKEQLAVLVLSTLAGFFASKYTEKGATSFLLKRKA